MIINVLINQNSQFVDVANIQTLGCFKLLRPFARQFFVSLFAALHTTT